DRRITRAAPQQSIRRRSKPLQTPTPHQGTVQPNPPTNKQDRSTLTSPAQSTNSTPTPTTSPQSFSNQERPSTPSPRATPRAGWSPKLRERPTLTAEPSCWSNPRP